MLRNRVTSVAGADMLSGGATKGNTFKIESNNL